MAIPKIIVQTDISSPEQYVIDKIVSKSPGWIYVHYNDESAVQFFLDNYLEEFKDVVQKFNEMPSGAHKADLFRYYFLYIYGGVFFDSDAMIEVDINEIIKDYDFFSVYSSVEPNTIFQGFLGATPKNPIIYRALQDTYNTEAHRLYDDYFLFCRNLYNIIHDFTYHFKIKLYREELYDEYASVIDDENRCILTHYWKTKVIPK